MPSQLSELVRPLARPDAALLEHVLLIERAFENADIPSGPQVKRAVRRSDPSFFLFNNKNGTGH